MAREFDVSQQSGLGGSGGGSFTIGELPSRITINLGVIDIPYQNELGASRTKKGGKSSTPKSVQTTGDVAQILEDDYGIMRVFSTVMMPGITETIKESLVASLEDLMGAGNAGNPFLKAQEDITSMFKDFVITREVEHVGLPGVPTQAALKGVSHRRKHPYAKANPRRPSFIDTGMYVSSFVAWID